MTTKYAVGTEYCDDALDCHQYSQVLELAKSLHFINNADGIFIEFCHDLTEEMTIRDQEKHKMYVPLCLENFLF